MENNALVRQTLAIVLVRVWELYITSNSGDVRSVRWPAGLRVRRLDLSLRLKTSASLLVLDPPLR